MADPAPKKRIAAANKIPVWQAVVLCLVAGLASFGIGVTVWRNILTAGPFPETPVNLPSLRQTGQQPAGVQPAASAVAKFASADDFKSWLADANESAQSYGYAIGGGPMMLRSAAPMMNESAIAAPGIAQSAPNAAPVPAPAEAPTAYSQTNVQVAGIDEPDVVKTDGREIYFSPQQRYYYGGIMPMMAPSAGVSAKIMPPIPPQYQTPGVRTIKAFPPADMKLDGQVDKSGDLLLAGKVLAVFAGDGIYGYDVSDPASPSKKWSYDYENNHGLTAARLMNGKIYAVLRANIDQVRPCPILPLKSASAEVSIACPLIYHPVMPVPSDVTYSVIEIDPADGSVKNTVSFVGTWDTQVYMSEQALYVTNEYPGDVFAFTVGFLQANPGLAPSDIVDRLVKVAGYDISQAAKQAEMQYLLQKWLGGLTGDEQLKLQNDLANKMADYYKVHARELQRTGIVKVSTADLSVAASGSVPGSLLNQFSMDEYQDHLRVAVTVGGRGSVWNWQFGAQPGESVNDVYVLDAGLKQTGSVLDMGKGERIYSVRFINDRGFVVTFKETDPFYVLDLSNATSPQLRGELKIPGYSSYLHPLAPNVILGVGKENNQVKLSLFDVSDPANPAEKAKYTLDEYWTDVMNTHHAFLLDDRHQIFFMPGGKGGYVFSYAGGGLSLARAVSDIQAKRAIYINDYLYIVGEDKIVVLNEADWQQVNRLSLTQ